MRLNTFADIELHTDFNTKLLQETGFWKIPELINIETITKHADRIRGYKHIVLIGIGGSMLGPQVLLDMFYQHDKEIYTLDNVDPDQAAYVYGKIDPAHTHFIIQSKSGRTTEIVSHYSKVLELLSTQGLPFKEHITFVTDPKTGYFRAESSQHDIPTLDIPPEVGGRFSVMTPVGLLIGAIVGADITAMVSGYADTRSDIKEDRDNTAKTLASHYLQAYDRSEHIIVFMVYSWRLRRFSNWLTQLFSESLGKRLNVQGDIVEIGSTPLPSVGVTDQHSQLQLFQEGPRDKIMTFISHDYEESIQTGESSDHSHVSKRPFSDIIKAELEGTIESIGADNRSWLHLSISSCNAYELGRLFFTFQATVAYMAQAWNIDAYNQPGVEGSKDAAYRILQG